MKKVAILLPDNCYAPEVYALDNFLRKNSLEIKSEIVSYELLLKRQYDFDLVYMMMGFSPLFFNDIKISEIHDYASLSTGGFKNIKNFIKRNFQKKPVHRFFLNNQVKEIMNFNDGIGYSFRDMGVDEEFFNIKKDKVKEYDFCYIGSITDDRKIDELLNIFLKNKNKNICLVGENNLSKKDKYIRAENIFFLGRRDRAGVLEVLSKSEIGINYTPNTFPFNKQTSTKVLEYLAAGLDVVSNHYDWVNEFEKEIGINFWDIKDLGNNILARNIDEFSHRVRSWDEVFHNTNIINVILES